MSAYVTFIPKGFQNVYYGFGEVELDPEKEYVLLQSWVVNDSAITPGFISELGERFKTYNINIDANNKNILFIRTAGGGDMLFLSPLAKLIKDKYPTCKITLACIKEQHDIAKNVAYFDNVISVPILLEEFNKFDYHFDVAGILEKTKDFITNAYDLYLAKLGVEVDENKIALIDKKYKQPYIKYDKDLKLDYIHNQIGIHPFTNDPIRQLDISLIALITQSLISRGYYVVIFSNQKERQIYQNLFPRNNVIWSSESFEMSIKKALQCSTMIVSDSLMCHVAQALNIETILITGPFNPISRIKYYDNITIIDTNPNCRCNLHGIGHCPKGFIISPCVRFDPIHILRLFDESINDKYNSYYVPIENKLGYDESASILEFLPPQMESVTLQHYNFNIENAGE